MFSIITLNQYNNLIIYKLQEFNFDFQEINYYLFAYYRLLTICE